MWHNDLTITFSDAMYNGALIAMIPTDVPIGFKRVQFHIRLAFTMPISKSKGQTMYVCSLDLSTPCFSHGR